MKTLSSIAIDTGTAARVAGISASNLHYWVGTGLIRLPVVRHPSGNGVTRLWRWPDLVALRTIVRLRAAGVTLQAVRQVVAMLRRERPGLEVEHPLSSARLVLDGRDVVLVRSDRELISMLKRPGQGVFSVVALADVAREIRTGLADLTPAAPKKKLSRKRCSALEKAA